MRLFVSVDLPPELTDAVATLQAEFDDIAGLQFTDPTQAHITLKFFGSVPADRLESVTKLTKQAVDAAALAPFRVELTDLGVFPTREYIRVLWLGVDDGTAPLQTLHDELEHRAVDAGFDPAEHSFTPHVTLARMEHAGGKKRLQRRLDRSPTVGSFEVTAVRVTESELTQAGPVYHTRDRIELPPRTD